MRSELDVGPQDRAREVVLARAAVARPVHEQARARGRRPSPRAGHGPPRPAARDPFSAACRRTRRRPLDDAVGVAVDVSGQRVRRVGGLEVARRRAPGRDRGPAAKRQRLDGRRARGARAASARAARRSNSEATTDALLAAGIFTRDFAIPPRVMEPRPGPRHRPARHGPERARLRGGSEVDVEDERHDEADEREVVDRCRRAAIRPAREARSETTSGVPTAAGPARRAHTAQK